jgi:hypothetical protein
MQTFLPYPDFEKSARVLDERRCWKQVIEARQIINCLSQPTMRTGWCNHPAVKMWNGYIPALKEYFNSFLNVCLIKWNINTEFQYYITDWKEVETIKNLYPTSQDLPWWFGNEDFHRAMRARLIEKYREFYLPLWPEDEGFNSGKYLWPIMESKTFRTI